MKTLLRAALCLLCAVMIGCSAAAAEQPILQSDHIFTAEGALPAGCAESSLGSLAADAVLAQSGADLVILPAGLMTGTLEAGAVFASDLVRVFPDDAALFRVYVTPAQLKALLEHGAAQLTTDDAEQIDVAASAWEGFPQIAGFFWEYDVSAPAGGRVTRLLIGSDPLDFADDHTRYELVSPASLFDGSLGYPVRDAAATGLTLRTAVSAYCAGRAELAEPASRTAALGTASYPLFGKLPIAALAACILILLLAPILRIKQDACFSFKPKLRDYK